MKFLLLLLALLAIVTVSTGWRTFMRGRSRYDNLKEPTLSSEKDVLPEEQWFTQDVDHFNPLDNSVWKQRYFVNSDFYKPNGPIFLMIGAEGFINPMWVVKGQWIEYAKELGAMCFYLEHRYYGKSHPTVDLSLNNLIFLSSEIALGDVANFIEGMNVRYNFTKDTKWIAFGGSYGGSLAAWMRVKYTHLVHGAVSSSGPLLAKMDFQEYYIVVENALKEYSQKCVDAVAEAISQFHMMMDLRQQQIAAMFNLCDPIDSKKKVDVANLYETLAGNLANIVQYNKDNRQNSRTANITIKTICDVMMDKKIAMPVNRLTYVNDMLLAATEQKCLDYRYDKMIHELRNVSWASEQAEGARQWMYQTCAEFGFFQTSTARPKLFSDTFPVDFFVQQCIDVFGPDFNKNLVETAISRWNIFYGGLDLRVTNVVFVHGSVDPWHVLGMTHSSNPRAPAIFINGTAHCADMYPSSEQDTLQLKQARIQIKGLIKQWLKN
ncbi:Putative serine protease K12H4.7 [Ooceraea biroi]|uniref:Putative serine protease K12H4.7 n=1 Tax=Ooceraea biroi TaxID=2015173 RepID=A0A026VW46_OOCBI|nr:Putative serine protease K12H4.7 [Ooceraea biroi]